MKFCFSVKLIKVTFSGIFNNVKITENFMINNRVIKTTTKVLSKINTAEYLIDKGYYIFGSMLNIVGS